MPTIKATRDDKSRMVIFVSTVSTELKRECEPGAPCRPTVATLPSSSSNTENAVGIVLQSLLRRGLIRTSAIRAGSRLRVRIGCGTRIGRVTGGGFLALAKHIGVAG